MDRRFARATHEAGHAALAVALGVRVYEVSILADTEQGHGGVCRHAPTQPEIAILIRAGGLAAERLAFGSDVLRGSRTDFRLMADLIRRYGPAQHDMGATVARWIDHAEARLRLLWPVVAEIREGLLERDRLDAHDVALRAGRGLWTIRRSARGETAGRAACRRSSLASGAVLPPARLLPQSRTAPVAAHRHGRLAA